MSDFAGKNILVTGGAGFIGSNVAKRLVHEHANVYIIDGMYKEMGGNVHNLRGIMDKVSFLEGSIGDINILSTLPKLDIIFNIAGQVSHQDSMRVPLYDLEINAHDQLAFLEWVRVEQQNAVIAYTSTRQIYGKPQYLPVDELHAVHPPDINGVHKLATEYYHSLYAKVYGLKTVSLRLTNTYGPGQLLRHSRQGFIAWFIRQALLGGKIELFGGGEQLRDFTFVDDVVEALILAVSTPACWGNVYNLNGEIASLASVAEILQRAVETNVTVEVIPFPEERKQIDIGSFYGTSEKFCLATGWTPSVGLQKGLEKTITFYLQEGTHYL